MGIGFYDQNFSFTSALQTLTDNLLRIWAPSYSREGQVMALFQFLGAKVANSTEPPVVGVYRHQTKSGVQVLELLTTVESENLDLVRLREKANLGSTQIHVTQTGEIRPCVDAARGGDSLGNQNAGGIGTLGCLVEDKTGDRFILSCNHVIAALNQGKRKEDPIWRENPKNRIGVLWEYKELDFSLAKGNCNFFDAALCRLDDGIDIQAGIRELGLLTGSARADEPEIYDLEVKKRGRQTGTTYGAVRMGGGHIVTYASGVRALFEKQLLVVGTSEANFAKQGDSGAVVIDNNNAAVGLLYATATGVDQSFVSPINPILEFFGVHLVLR